MDFEGLAKKVLVCRRMVLLRIWMVLILVLSCLVSDCLSANCPLTICPSAKYPCTSLHHCSCRREDEVWLFSMRGV